LNIFLGNLLIALVHGYPLGSGFKYHIRVEQQIMV
jgi:hypothetical protein